VTLGNVKDSPAGLLGRFSLDYTNPSAFEYAAKALEVRRKAVQGVQADLSCALDQILILGNFGQCKRAFLKVVRDGVI